MGGAGRTGDSHMTCFRNKLPPQEVEDSYEP